MAWGVLVKRFIPCVRNSDNAAGRMLQSAEFFTVMRYGGIQLRLRVIIMFRGIGLIYRQ
jgi:hypothetical protein